MLFTASRLIATEVSPDEIDDVGLFVKGWVDGSGAFGRSLRTIVEFGDDEALVGVVVLLVLCLCGWLDKEYVRMCLDKHVCVTKHICSV